MSDAPSSVLLLACVKESIWLLEGLTDGNEECEADTLCAKPICQDSGCIVDKLLRARAAVKRLTEDGSS